MERETKPSAYATLLRSVVLRLWAAHAARTALQLLLVLAGVYVAWLVAARLFAWPEPRWWCAASLLPVAALAAGLLTLRGRAQGRWQHAAARALDARGAHADLFLTRLLLDRAPGAYQPLVAERAEAAAARMDPRAIAPLDLARPGAAAVATALVLAAATVLVPRVASTPARGDPRELRAQSESRRSEQKKLTQARAELLTKNDVKAELSKPLAAQLAQLAKELREMQKEQPRQNAERLQSLQKSLGEAWRQGRGLALGKDQAQSLGTALSARAAQWREELKAGSAEGLDKELQALAELARQLDDRPDARVGEAGKQGKAQSSPQAGGRDQKQLQQELRSRLDQLRRAAGSERASRQLREALERAEQQLQALALEGMSPEGARALLDSLELGGLEADALAQAARDLKNLERALETLRLAKVLNSKDPLDGDACKDCDGLSDYEAFYRQCLEGLGGDQPLPGPGGGPEPGIGQGGNVGEDPKWPSGFLPERSRSALTAGRLLMELKDSGLPQHGKAVLDHAEAIRQVQQGASEAILHENVPPGYHEAIKGYFDKLGAPRK